MKRTGVVLLVLSLVSGASTEAQRASTASVELSALMTIGVQTAVEALIPAFEKANGQRVATTWGTSAMMSKQVQDGAKADVLVSTRAGIDGLMAEKKVIAGSDAVVAQSRVGVAVRRGAPKPDISTPDALKRALLAAEGIAYSNPAAGGTSGVHFASVLEQLGIADQVKARVKFPPAGGYAARLLASGEADLAVQQMPELAAVEGAELVGPLPAALQLVTTFVAGVPTSAAHPDAAKAFIRFLRTPESLAVMKAKGLDISGP